MEASREAATARELWSVLEECATDGWGSDQSTWASFRDDLASAVDCLASLASELKGAFHICPQLHHRLSSPQSAAEFTVLLEEDEARRDSTRAKIEKLCEIVTEAEAMRAPARAVRDILPRLGESGDRQLQKELRELVRRTQDVEKELDEWCKSARRGLEEVAGSVLAGPLDVRNSLAAFLATRPDPGPGAPNAAPTTSSTPPVASSAAGAAGAAAIPPANGPSRRRVASTEQQAAALRPLDPKPSSAGARGPGHTVHGVRREDAEFAWASLRKLAKRNLRVPSDLAQNARIRRSREAMAKILTVRLLVAECSVVRGKLEDAQLKSFALETPATVANRTASAISVDGATVDVRWTTESREHFFSDAKLPRERIEREDGKPVWTKTVDAPSGSTRLDSQLDVVSAHFGPEARDEIEKFLAESSDSSRGRARRVARVEFEMVAVPVRELICGPAEGTNASAAEFTMWVYGQRPRFHADGYPQGITPRLLAVLVGGALIASLVAWFVVSTLSA